MGLRLKVWRPAEGAGQVPTAAPGRPTSATHATHPGSCPAPPPPCPRATAAFEEGPGEAPEGHEMGCPPLPGALTSSKKARVLMATRRPRVSVMCAPRRCSASDAVPMMRTTTTGSLLWKKPLRKGGSCPRSRLPCGRGRRWAECASVAPSQTPIQAWAPALYPLRSILPWLCHPGRRAPSPALSPGSCGQTGQASPL